MTAFLAIKRLFEFRQGDQIEIHLLSGNSTPNLEAFTSNQFDFIYIEGDRKYEAGLGDVSQDKQLIRKGFRPDIQRRSGVFTLF